MYSFTAETIIEVLQVENNAWKSSRVDFNLDKF